MTDKDRGTYSPPTEDSLSYETRRTTARDQAPITLIISGIFLVLLLLAVVLFYNSGLNTHGRPAPDVGDAMGDIKDAKVEDAKPLSDQDLLEPSTDVSGGATFAPGTEAPLRDQTSQAAVDQAPPPAAPIQGPLPSQANNAAITGQPAATTAPAATTKPVVAAATPPATVAAKPVVTPAKPVVTPVKPVVTAPAASSASASVAAKPAAGGAVVQIGAFESTDIANKEYAKVASSYGLFLGGTSKRVEKVETAKGTFYRTSFVGFASADKAKSFCAALKSSGHDCFVK